MTIVGVTPLKQFDQHVLNMALINLCDRASHVGQQLRRLSNQRQDDTDEPATDPWLNLHQIKVYLPHPQQQYDGVTLEAGLTQGFNIELQPITDQSHIPYRIPRGGQFVIVLKQKGLDSGFEVVATGIFIRPLAVLRLDVIVDRLTLEYQSILIKHPILREYPSNWQNTLNRFLDQQLRYEELPNLAAHVDQAFNPDYHPPRWDDLYLATGQRSLVI